MEGIAVFFARKIWEVQTLKARSWQIEWKEEEIVIGENKKNWRVQEWSEGVPPGRNEEEARVVEPEEDGLARELDDDLEAEANVADQHSWKTPIDFSSTRAVQAISVFLTRTTKEAGPGEEEADWEHPWSPESQHDGVPEFWV